MRHEYKYGLKCCLTTSMSQPRVLMFKNYRNKAESVVP